MADKSRGPRASRERAGFRLAGLDPFAAEECLALRIEHVELDELCSYAGLLRGASAWPPGVADDAADQFGFAAFEDPTLDRPIFARAFGARRPDPDAWCFFDTPLTPDAIWILGAVADALFRRRRARVLREMVERARQHRAL